LCGETGLVTENDILKSINNMLKDTAEDDILIFYFSDHDGKIA
jgi:glucan phosphoethanolaminetransferase (alkaline phosphatase superfamily)